MSKAIGKTSGLRHATSSSWNEMDDLLFDDSVLQESEVSLQAHGRYLNNRRGNSKPGKCHKPRAMKGKAGAHQKNMVRPSDHHVAAPAATLELELQGAFDQEQHQPSSGDQHNPEGQSWSARQAVETDNWDNIRSAVFQDVVAARTVPATGSVCSSCGYHASVVCDNCPVAALCLKCDVQRHTSQPFHRRRHWVRGFLEPLSPGVSVSATGEFIEFAPVLPLYRSKKVCRTCKADCEMQASSAMVIVITLQGRFDLHVPVWLCATCGITTEVSHIDLVRCGFYRASPVRLSTVIHEDVFIMWQKLRSRSPGTSLTAYISSLEELGKTYGCDRPVDFERLEKAFTEWTCIQFELQGLQGSDFMACEACGAEPRCVHLDGNAKVYRYRSSGSSEMESAYHVGTFIEDRDAVNAHVDKMKSVTKTSNRCGLSTWTAGRNDAEALPSKRSQDETGLVTATCRHSVILGGVNMYRGESFAYSHFLHQERFPHVQYFASDIVCKYWPWAQRVSRRWPEYSTGDSMPFLSVMHATGHAYYCQITFGGFWRDGSGWSIMETTEIANAFLSRAANTTKYMTAAQRNDALTGMVIKYNEEKHERMPRLLVSRLQDAEKRIPELQCTLTSLLDEHGVSQDRIAALVEDLRNLARALSSRDVQSDGRNLENAIEMTSDSLRVRLAAVTNVASSAKQRRRCRRLATTDKARLAKLLKRYERETGENVAMADAVEGVFPWHVQPTESGGLTLSVKRAICDTHMRLQRSLEELGIVREEMERLLNHSRTAIAQLIHTLKVVEEQLDRDQAERTSLIHLTATSNRYCIQEESEATLRGLRALMCQAIAERQTYLDIAQSLLQQYLPGRDERPL
ncbi:uncharacterized protein LOC122386681 isoform X3 [Amphibalanus amphitrite]|uniref:uncharacterized protein LOC122386681 isoform X3 n=3 Tax=Amphibalanus amphitrite TaxID=1232801 RepID=UPI001C903B50|nr:uncharacterized protein LOC122386681 isoform X3 [Amphibalanus amphitrite]